MRGYRCPYGTSTIGAERRDACARMIEYVLEREGDIAAFIAEPMRAVPRHSTAWFLARACAMPATATARF